MAPDEFRDAAHRVSELVAEYLANLESYAVLPAVRPGEISSRLPAEPPLRPEALEIILEDYARLIAPHVTHWQHPGFMAYFPSVASGPGILGEWLAAGLNSNVMFWKNAPASTELEERTVSWIRQMLGLGAEFDGMLTDTASVSSLLAIVAARHAVPGLDSRENGLSGSPPLRLYVSEEAHSSIEKAGIVAGVGRSGVRKIPVDEHYAMRAEELERAIAEDRAHGYLPFCVVGTIGTTSSTAIDPVAELARISERERLWLHVDAAYGGAAALVPEQRGIFRGWERADSIVFNPHKWMFTPFDASLLLFRGPERFRDAFSLLPAYLEASRIDHVHNYSEYGIQLGRRFRALKLWMLIRYFGTEGIAARIREHCRLARLFAGWVRATAGWEVLAPVPFSTVCFRYRGASLGAGPSAESRLEAWNRAILDEVNGGGRFYLSATRLGERFTLRVALGNPRAGERHVRECWDVLRSAAGALAPDG